MKPKLRHTLQRLFGAVSCLWVYLLAATPLLPLGTALTAWVDGEHSVSFAVGSGEVRVVLAHDNADPRRAVGHPHCPISRTLVAFAEQDASTYPDHVLGFAAPSSLVWSRSVVSDLAGPVETAASLKAGFAVLLPDLAEALRPRANARSVACAPPVGLRTTVLLI